MLKIGYACSNASIKATTNKTFRLASYSSQKIEETIEINIEGLKKMIEWNHEQKIDFFRIGSGVIPFASHEMCDYDWQSKWKTELKAIGKNIKNMRISMHPGQFVLINSPREDVVQKSITELLYHVEFLDLLGLDNTAKIQIHVGGVYGDKSTAIARFIKNYHTLPQSIKNRLAIENDDSLFSLKDCLQIHEATKIPIIFDTFHHECLNNNEPMKEAIQLAQNTWSKTDGRLMLDYSSQMPDAKRGKHIDDIDLEHFKSVLTQFPNKEIDIMLEIKNKEISVHKAQEVIENTA